jgi:hypothetical protein
MAMYFGIVVHCLPKIRKSVQDFTEAPISTAVIGVLCGQRIIFFLKFNFEAHPLVSDCMVMAEFS